MTGMAGITGRIQQGTGPETTKAAAPWWGESAAFVLFSVPARRCRSVELGGAAQLNESPQAQEPVAFGLSIVKPCFSMVSTKSMEAPPR
jgi:hypothetical protein